MAPSNQSPGHVTPHVAVAHVVPTAGPQRFYGACAAGDFVAKTEHATQEAAKADVTAHVSEMQPV